MRIHAEATQDRQGLVLLAAGGDPALGGEDVALAAKQLKALTPLFAKSDPPGALVTALTWPTVVQLSATFGTNWVPGPGLCDWITEQVSGRQAPATTSYAPPAGLTPYPWQTAGAAMIAVTGGALITDEPGTGKTATAILGLVERAQWPALVVCPASVVDAWVEAWATWAPHVRAVAWRGTPKARHALAGTADVYVTSYETARVDTPPGKKGPLAKLAPAALVIDECHLIKSPGAERSKAVRRLAATAQCVVALSGTPITHHPADLWPTLVALSHDAWPSRERWVKRYCSTIQGDYKEEILGLNPYAEAEFRLCLLGQQRRVAKADVLADLPPKVYSVRTVELPADWRRVYDDFEEQMLAELPDGSELSVMDVLSVLAHLRSLSAAAADVEISYGPDVDERTGEPKRHVHLELKAPSWKVDALLEVLEERIPNGEQVVAFAPSRQLMMLAGAAAAEAGYRVGYVVGEQTPKVRTETVAAFQAGQLDLICATTGAGGVGITLTAARTVVFLQRPWSLVESLQAEDRCHRIGSQVHDSIEVIDIVAADTVDTRVRAVLRERAGQLADLVQDPRILTELLGGDGSTVTPVRSSLPPADTSVNPGVGVADEPAEETRDDQPVAPDERTAVYKSVEHPPLRGRYVCRLQVDKPTSECTPEEFVTATASGLKSRWDRAQKCEVLPMRCTLDTTDTAAYLEHMADEHGGSRDKVYESPTNGVTFLKTHRLPVPIPVPMWKPPKVTVGGKPLPAKATDEHGLHTCGACGLIAEVDDTEASQLWWREHAERCAGEQAGAA